MIGRRLAVIALAVATMGGSASVATAATDVPGLAHHVAPACAGNGHSGNRVQVLYLYAGHGRTGRRPIIRKQVRIVDDVFAASALRNGGDYRRVRWVTNRRCVVKVPRVRVPARALRSWPATVKALRRAGFRDPHRKYLAFTESSVLCGQGRFFRDDHRRHNFNNGRAASYARVDRPCWARSDHSTPAHELVHMLGGVQPTAPHGTWWGHCSDGYDTMCYDDGSGISYGDSACPNPADAWLLDCGGDDYFNTRPERGSWLARHWNVANSSFLARHSG